MLSPTPILQVSKLRFAEVEQVPKVARLRAGVCFIPEPEALTGAAPAEVAREGTSCCLRTDTEPQGERPGPCSAAPPSRPSPVSGPPHAQGSLASSWLPGHAPGSLCQSSWVQTGWGREVPGPSSCEGCVCGMCVCSIGSQNSGPNLTARPVC